MRSVTSPAARLAGSLLLSGVPFGPARAGRAPRGSQPGQRPTAATAATAAAAAEEELSEVFVVTASVAR